MRAFVVVGMGYGDEGKGTIVDYLTRREGAGLVVRFNGGPQAGHNVVTSSLLPGYVWRGIGLPDGEKIDRKHHEFRQFGSGSFEGARTHLSRYCVFNPEMIFLEADQLRKKMSVTEPLRLLSVDELAAVITPFHVAANRAREVARGARHGSCGMGIWETEKDRRNPDVYSLLAADLKGMDERQLRRELIMQRERKREEIRPLVDAGSIPGGWANVVLRDLQDGVPIPLLAETYKIFGDVVNITDGVPAAEVMVFEGAQGILLDENLGFHPHTTGSTTTSQNAVNLCEEVGCDDVQVIGVTRAYATRHGAGPFPTETDDLGIPEPHNKHGQWQGAWRQGWTDLVALKYAADCDPNISQVAVTHLDSVREACDVTWSVADTYDGLGWDKLPLVPKNRAQQERVGKFMANARPRYAQCDPEKVDRAIEDHLDLPVTITSEGPTYHDKRCPSLKI